MPIGKWLIIKGYDKKKERAPRDPDKEPRPPAPPPKEVTMPWPAACHISSPWLHQGVCRAGALAPEHVCVGDDASKACSAGAQHRQWIGT